MERLTALRTIRRRRPRVVNSGWGWPTPRTLIHTFSWTTFFAAVIFILSRWAEHGLESVPPIAMVLAIPYVPFALFLATGLLVHELGHAVAAWLAGMRLFEISLGTHGETLFRFRLHGVALQVKQYPLDGFVQAGHKSLNFIRLREAVMILGGPIANVLVCLAAFLVLYAGGISYSSLEGLLLLFLGITNALRTLFNLYPRQMAMGVGTTSSDGLALLKTPVLTREERSAMHADYYLREGIASRESGDSTKALEWFALGMAKYPSDISLMIWSGVVCLESNRYGQARRAFKDLLARSNLDEHDRLQGYIYLTWIDLTIGNPALLPEADAASQAAIDIAPDDLVARYARGCALIELDRSAEGIEMLQSAVAEDTTPTYSAFATTFIAIGFVKASNLLEARRHLESARALDAHCVFIPLAERRIFELENERSDGIAEPPSRLPHEIGIPLEAAIQSSGPAALSVTAQGPEKPREKIVAR